ncbi:hypothetical protein C8R46DRAFT_1213748 [Mycena filopes]|nr:hypothetical protein C8R46DRAFT_1213748 [Mycena filopes]
MNSKSLQFPKSLGLINAPPDGPDPPIPFDKPPADRNHNENLIINRLPPELLAAIFVLVCEDSKLGDYSWVACSHICSSWRRLALETAPLWSHIVFTSSEWMRLCLERSKSSLLRIEADLTIHSNESLICEVLTLADRIGIIKIRFSNLGDPLLKLLAGPFPVLSALTLDKHGVQPPPEIPFKPNVQPYPNLHALCIYTDVPFPFPLSAPSRLVCLEIHNYGAEVVEWSTLRDGLRALGDLEALRLDGFPLPPANAAVDMIRLPNLRDLTLTGSVVQCRRLIQMVDSPWLRRYRIYPSDTDGVGELFQVVLKTLPRQLKSLMLRRPWRYHYAVLSQLAHIGFYYDDIHNLTASTAANLDVSFAWMAGSLPDSDLARIFAALSDIPSIDTIQWLWLDQWNTIPQGSWGSFLRRLIRLQTLVISGRPASGLVWDLVKQFESSPGRNQLEPTQFCPELKQIEMSGVDCRAGGWIPLRMTLGTTVNSHFDVDNAPFLELLVCYLEIRAPTGKLATLKLSNCFNYSVAEIKLLRLLVTQVVWDGTGMVEATVAEIKLLRLLVTQVVWDGTGMVEATYSPNGDKFSARTIKHHLLDCRSSYEEVNLTENERRRQENWTWWT